MVSSRVHEVGAFRIEARRALKGVAALAMVFLLSLGFVGAQEEPRAGGTLRVALGADIQPGNILAGRGGNVPFVNAVFDKLTVLNAETGEPEPLLATSWASSDEGKTFTVQLRDDVTFHNGRPFTAEDVVFTLEQMKVPENASQMRPLVEAYTSVEATGEYEVTITSGTPVAPRVFDVFQLAAIVDRETFSGLADGSQIVGTGPFKFVSWVPGASITLERNEAYWGEGPYLDAIEISVIPDPTALANALRGRADLILNMTPRDSVMFQGDPNIEVFTTPGGGIFPLGIDVTAPPFDNKELRQAIGFAIDRERIIDQVFNGVGDGSPLWWRSNEPGTTEAQTTYYHYDPERARELIAAAGAEGADVPIRVIGFGSAPAVYEIVQNNLREVGLNPIGEIVETAVFDEAQTAGNLGPAFMQSLGLQGFSAATLVDALPALRSDNPSKFNPPRYAELKVNLQSALDDEAYAEALNALTDYMLDEAFSHILVHSDPLNAKRTNVNGLVFDNIGYLHLNTAWLSN